MTKPIRVLQVVHRMDRGGIETWLMNVLRNSDRERFRFDFMVFTADHCAYDDEICALGSRIIPCAAPIYPIAHIRDLRRIMLSQGPYDVVHAHGTESVGAVLRAAAHAKVPIRIAHSHNTDAQGRRRLRSHAFKIVNQHWMNRYMTQGLGCSREACASLFDPQWQRDRRCQILHYGLDWQPFREEVDVPALRTELGIPGNALVIGHVGRFMHQKNHMFLIDIARAVTARRDDVYFLLVGDGVLRQQIEEQVHRLGLKAHFVFTGVRPDVYRLLQAVDVFLLPSHYEGLGIVVLEAQAVGLPCVVSDVVPEEATVIARQVRRLALSLGAEAWADAVLDAAVLGRRANHISGWRAVSNSTFSIDACLSGLTVIYEGSRMKAELTSGYAIS